MKSLLLIPDVLDPLKVFACEKLKEVAGAEPSADEDDEEDFLEFDLAAAVANTKRSSIVMCNRRTILQGESLEMLWICVDTEQPFHLWLTNETAELFISQLESDEVQLNLDPCNFRAYDFAAYMPSIDLVTDDESESSALTQQLWESQSDPIDEVPFRCRLIPLRSRGTCVGCMYSIKMNVTIVKTRLGLRNVLSCALKSTVTDPMYGTLASLSQGPKRDTPELMIRFPLLVLKSVEISTFLVNEEALFVKLTNASEHYDIVVKSMNTRTAPLQDDDHFPLTMPPASQYVISVPISLLRQSNSYKRAWTESEQKTVFTLAIHWHVVGGGGSWLQHAADCRPLVPTPLQMTVLSCTGDEQRLGSQLSIECQVANHEDQMIDLVILSPDVDDDVPGLLEQCAPALKNKEQVAEIILEHLLSEDTAAFTSWSLSYQVIGYLEPGGTKNIVLSAWVVGEQTKKRYPPLFFLDLRSPRLVLVEP